MARFNPFKHASGRYGAPMGRHGAGGYAQITQKASGVTRTVLRSSLPGANTLALCHELTFNRLCCEAFHGEK